MIHGVHPFLKAGPPSISTPITDESDSDAAPAKLLATLNLKRKTPTPEQSSDDMDIKYWFSPAATSSTSATSWKHVRPSVMDAVGQVTDTSKTMFSTIQAMQEQKVRDRGAERDLKRWVHQEKHTDNKMNREQSMARSKLRKMELQVQLQQLKVQEQAMQRGMQSGEGELFDD
jgi:hypothetical protein